MESAIEKHLDFRPHGVCTFVQVNDMKNGPGILKREVWAATNKAVQLLQDNYPEFVAKQVPSLNHRIRLFRAMLRSAGLVTFLVCQW